MVKKHFLIFFTITNLGIGADIATGQNDYVPGDLMVKLVDYGKGVVIGKLGRIATTGFSSIDSLHLQYGCHSIEKLYLGPAPFAGRELLS